MNFPTGGSPVPPFWINWVSGDGLACMSGVEKHPSFELNALPEDALFERLACPIDRRILGRQQLANPRSDLNEDVLSSVVN